MPSSGNPKLTNSYNIHFLAYLRNLHANESSYRHKLSYNNVKLLTEKQWNSYKISCNKASRIAEDIIDRCESNEMLVIHENVWKEIPVYQTPCYRTKRNNPVFLYFC